MAQRTLSLNGEAIISLSVGSCFSEILVVYLISHPAKAPVRPAPPPPLNIAKVNTSHVQHAVPASSRYSGYFLCLYIASRQKTSNFLFGHRTCKFLRTLLSAKCICFAAYSFISFVYNFFQATITLKL